MNEITENTDKFSFELVSPDRKLMSEPAWQVTIPGEEGTFGVRANHTSLVSSIRAGVVEIVSNQGDVPTKIFIAGGFADVTASHCTILAEEAIKLEELDQGTIEQEISSLFSKLENANDDVEIIRLNRQLTLAKQKLTAVTGSLAA